MAKQFGNEKPLSQEEIDRERAVWKLPPRTAYDIECDMSYLPSGFDSLKVVLALAIDSGFDDYHPRTRKSRG